MDNFQIALPWKDGLLVIRHPGHPDQMKHGRRGAAAVSNREANDRVNKLFGGGVDDAVETETPDGLEGGVNVEQEAELVLGGALDDAVEAEIPDGLEYAKQDIKDLVSESVFGAGGLKDASARMGKEMLDAYDGSDEDIKDNLSKASERAEFYHESVGAPDWNKEARSAVDKYTGWLEDDRRLGRKTVGWDAR